MPSVIAIKEAHGPPLFFADFTRRRMDLKSQWIWKKANNYFSFNYKICINSKIGHVFAL